MQDVFAPVPVETEHVATAVIGAAIEVHRQLGPGFLEKIYQEALCLELDARGLPFERERAVVVHYRGIPIPGQRIDLIVSGCVLVELKAAARIDACCAFTPARNFSRSPVSVLSG